MGWSALYDTGSGQLLSVGQILADPLPPHTAALPLAGPPSAAEMWDPVARAFVARPAKVVIDRLQDLVDDADFQQVWGSLNATQRAKIRTAVIRLLGRFRYRAVSEPMELG